MKRRITVLLLFSLITVGMAAQRAYETPLYPDGPRKSNGDPSDTAKVWIYLPEARLNTGRAVVICPGGAYEHLALQHEGHEWASFLNNQGIAAIVLKYRMPNGKPEIPIADAEAAIRLVRHNAQSWHVNADQVGIMGFSAGGHLAATVATQAKKEAAPNFQILFYPVITMMHGFTHEGTHDNFLGRGSKKRVEKEYSADQQVTRMTPRAWIALCDDDHVVLPANGANYYMELYRHDVPASLHVYPDGGHGWGSSIAFKYHIEMIMDLKAWLNSF